MSSCNQIVTAFLSKSHELAISKSLLYFSLIRLVYLSTQEQMNILLFGFDPRLLYFIYTISSLFKTATCQSCPYRFTCTLVNAASFPSLLSATPIPIIVSLNEAYQLRRLSNHQLNHSDPKNDPENIFRSSNYITPFKRLIKPLAFQLLVQPLRSRYLYP